MTHCDHSQMCIQELTAENYFKVTQQTGKVSEAFVYV